MKAITYLKILYFCLFTQRKYWRVKYPTGTKSFLTTYPKADTMANLSGGEIIIDFKYLTQLTTY